MLRKRCQKYILFGDYIIWARRKHITKYSPHICNKCKYIDMKTAQCQADDCGQTERYYCHPQTSGEYKYQPYDVKEV